MRMAKTCGTTRLAIYGESNLIIQQVMRDCDAVVDNMAAYQKLYNTLEGSFDSCELNYISRANNTEADELANIGSTRGPVPLGVFLESINQRSIKIKAAAPRQPQTTTTPPSQRRWQQRVHPRTPAPKHPTPQLQQHSKAQPGRNSSSDS